MQTLILEEPGRFVRGERPEPHAPGPGEALVRVHAMGVCGTDLHAFEGTQPFFSYPRVLGHELGVEVLEVGAGVDHVAPGDRCALEPYLSCGTCVACRAGKTNCCVDLRVLGVQTDGGMGGRLVLPAHLLLPSPSLSYDELALVETLSIGAHAVRRAAVREGEAVLVVGAGPIGLSTVACAQAAGARVLTSEIRPDRIAFAREHLGGVVLDGREPLLPQLLDHLDGELPTVVFDATGNADAMQDAFGYVAHGGRLVFVGIVRQAVAFDDPSFHRRETTLVASRCATAEDLQWAMDAVEGGSIDLKPWISEVAALDEAPDRFPIWIGSESGIIKAVIRF